MKQSQNQWVREQLKENGSISRNQCLEVHITRLSAIIQDLEEAGYTFHSSKIENDWVYKLVNSPKRRVYSFDEIERDGVRMIRETVSYI